MCDYSFWNFHRSFLFISDYNSLLFIIKENSFQTSIGNIFIVNQSLMCIHSRPLHFIPILFGQLPPTGHKSAVLFCTCRSIVRPTDVYIYRLPGDCRGIVLHTCDTTCLGNCKSITLRQSGNTYEESAGC